MKQLTLIQQLEVKRYEAARDLIHHIDALMVEGIIGVVFDNMTWRAKSSGLRDAEDRYDQLTARIRHVLGH
jgi:hypothetical protein